MGFDRLRPEFVTDLRKRFIVKVGDVVQTAVDGGDFFFGQLQGDFLFPKLIQRKIVVNLWTLSQ